MGSLKIQLDPLGGAAVAMSAIQFGSSYSGSIMCTEAASTYYLKLQVLRIVAAMVLGAACYLSAFTATTACDEDASAGCARAAWHHVTAAAELLLLAAGLRIAHAARNANVPFQVIFMHIYYKLKLLNNVCI